jgi:hypothetical protein
LAPFSTKGFCRTESSPFHYSGREMAKLGLWARINTDIPENLDKFELFGKLEPMQALSCHHEKNCHGFHRSGFCGEFGFSAQSHP